MTRPSGSGAHATGGRPVAAHTRFLFTVSQIVVNLASTAAAAALSSRQMMTSAAPARPPLVFKTDETTHYDK